MSSSTLRQKESQLDCRNVPFHHPGVYLDKLSNFQGKCATSAKVKELLKTGEMGPTGALQSAVAAAVLLRRKAEGHELKHRNRIGCSLNFGDKLLHAVCQWCAGIELIHKGIYKVCKTCGSSRQNIFYSPKDDGTDGTHGKKEWHPHPILKPLPRPMLSVRRPPLPKGLLVQSTRRAKTTYMSHSKIKRDSVLAGYTKIGKDLFGRDLEKHHNKKHGGCCDCCFTPFASPDNDHFIEVDDVVDFWPGVKPRSSGSNAWKGGNLSAAKAQKESKENPMARLCPVCHQWLTNNGPVKTTTGWAERVKDDTIDLASLYTQFTMKHFYTGAGLKCEHPPSVLLGDLCPHFTTLPGVQPLPTHETVGMCFPMLGTMVMDHVSYLLFTFVLFF